jgi:hypothetical protein
VETVAEVANWTNMPSLDDSNAKVAGVIDWIRKYVVALKIV